MAVPQDGHALVPRTKLIIIIIIIASQNGNRHRERLQVFEHKHLDMSSTQYVYVNNALKNVDIKI